MKVYLIDLQGNIRHGKVNTWSEVWSEMKYGERLYNPYTKRPVIGWKKYCAEMAKGQEEFYSKLYKK